MGPARAALSMAEPAAGTVACLLAETVAAPRRLVPAWLQPEAIIPAPARADRGSAGRAATTPPRAVERPAEGTAESLSVEPARTQARSAAEASWSQVEPMRQALRAVAQPLRAEPAAM